MIAAAGATSQTWSEKPKPISSMISMPMDFPGTTVIAANGDTLNITLSGDLDPAAGMDTGPIQFVGGTGRFAGASGSGQFVVELNPATGAFKTTVVGKINF